MLNPYVAFFKVLRRYFNAYGGLSALCYSPIVSISLIVNIINYKSWIEFKWIDRAYSMIPNLLGFSLGAYSILFSVMTGRLKNALRSVKNGRGVSFLDELNATFFHFIAVQILCLMWSFVYESGSLGEFCNILCGAFRSKIEGYIYYLSLFGSFCGSFILIYSILLILSAAIAVYRVAQIRDPSEG